MDKGHRRENKQTHKTKLGWERSRKPATGTGLEGSGRVAWGDMVRTGWLTHHCGKSLEGLAPVKWMAAGRVKADRFRGDISRTC